MRPDRFTDQHVFIFGGNSGIGLAAARGFKAEGARLTLTGRDQKTLDAAASELGALTLRSDMGKPKESRAAVAQGAAAHGPIDVLCVNAGVGGFAPIAEITEAFWDDIHDVNLKGAFFAAQAALPHLKDNGAIVFTGSIGALTAVPGNATYAAAKAGLRAAARIFAVELVSRGVRVNLVSPGPTETPLFNRNPGMSADAVEAMRVRMREVTPMKRIGDAEEVAAAVLFLASHEASFVTGVDLYVDGGILEL